MSSKVLIIGGAIVLILVLVGSYFLFAGGSKPQVNIASYSASDKEKPKAEVKELLKDMGEIKVSDEKTESFILKNTGQKPLQISNVSSSCNCTFVKIVMNGKESEEFGMHNVSDYAGEIAPGKDTTVKVIYRPFVMPVYGVVEREVYITTNDPENSKLIFKVKAYVK